jgi:hypothetical protein
MSPFLRLSLRSAVSFCVVGMNVIFGILFFTF